MDIIRNQISLKESQVYLFDHKRNEKILEELKIEPTEE
jgi:hypothetical protein